MTMSAVYWPVQSSYSLADLRKIHAALPANVAKDLTQRSVFAVLETLAAYHRRMHRHALEMALQHIHGRVPASHPDHFAFMLLGSGAREEQSIRSDQDHAFVYEEQSVFGREAEDYFRRLAETTAALLHEIGYPFCSGNIMASNARWRGTNIMWHERLAKYSDFPDWDNIRFLLIASDAAVITGDGGLVGAIRKDVAKYVSRSPFIRWKVADQGLASRLALTLLGGIRVEGKGDHKGTFHIKDGLYSPLVNSIRIWALSLDIEEPSSKVRLRRLCEQKAWSKELADQVTEALETSLYMRLRHHVTQAMNDMTIDDHIIMEELSELERDKVKRALRTARLLQQVTARQFPRPG